ncbi:MAG: YggS family pyridoxal phosphate-dependent enzyme [Candidatus Dormiibacterota bacterium]
MPRRVRGPQRDRSPAIRSARSCSCEAKPTATAPLTEAILRQRLEQVWKEIREAEDKSGRPAGSVHLLPVTKGHPAETAELATMVGLTRLGENYVQECQEKDRFLRATGAPAVSWHLLGHLQRNKVARAAQLFQSVASVDSLELARKLSAARSGQPPLPVLCEVELTGLPNRTGFQPAQLQEAMPQLVELAGIAVDGLMTVAAPHTPRATFSACRKLAEGMRELSGLALSTLSMGMTGDFQAAIAEGSTEVRIGTLLFGDRQAPRH